MLPQPPEPEQTSDRLAALRRSYVLWLAARVAIANAFLFALIGLSLYQSRQQYESQASATTQNLALSLEVNVAGILDKMAISVGAVALEVERQRAAGGLRDRDIDTYLRRQLVPLPEISAIRYANAQGETQFAAGSRGSAAARIDATDYFQRARSSAPGSVILSKAQYDALSGKWVILLARATYGPDGRFCGVVSAALPLAYFTDLFAPLDVGRNSVLAIRDEQLALVARKPANEPFESYVGNRSISDQAAASIALHPDSGSYMSAAMLDGIERRVAYRRTPHWPLTVFVGDAVDNYLAAWRKERAVLASLGLLFLLASLWSARAAFRTRRAEFEAIDALRVSKEQLQRSETRFRTLYDTTIDAVTLLDMERFIDCNAAAMSLFGIASKDVLLRNAPGLALSPPQQPCGTESRVLARRKFTEAFEKGSVRFDWLHRRVDTGAIFPTEVQLTRMTLDGVPLLQAVTRDITQRKKAEEEIRYLAYFDALTGLPNRRLLMDRLAHALLSGERTREFGVLMILDLDNFKSLNDTCGHDVGDHLLIEVAKRIVGCVRQEDTVARLGGDEFVVLAAGLGNDEAQAAGQAEQIAAKIARMVGLPGLVAGSTGAYHNTASIGLTLFRGGETAIDALLKQADLALYQAKGAGRNTVRFFNPEMQSAIDARTAMEAALRDGLRRDEFALFYQPQIDSRGRVTGAEALLRWLPAGGPPVAPGQFISLAEETGLIIPIGLWVMQSACEQLRAWADHPVAHRLSIAINVSSRQFREADFTDQVRACLARSGANPARLKLELTESVVLEDIDNVIVRMRALKALGLTLSLDDFGTGFSSLSYLKRLPLDQVKIDQSFVRDVVSDANDGAIVQAIVAMSRTLGIEVIAEGVETREQLDFLKASGCDHFQGYLFGRPVPVAQWEALLRQSAIMAI